jgi:membrane protein
MATANPRLYLFQPSSAARFWGLLRRSLEAAQQDNCFGIAKGAAYSALLSFFPVLTSLAAILARTKAEAVARVISRFLFEAVPPGSEDLVRYVFSVKGQRPVSLLIGATAVSLWAASGAMTSLMEGFQAAYRLPTGRSFLKQRAMAIALVFVAALPALGASALVLFGSRFEREFMQGFGLTPEGIDLRPWLVLLGRLLRLGAAFLTIVGVNMLFYYLGPNREMRLRGLWPGALLATVLWFLATLAFAWYVRNIANYNVLYGGLGTLIALLTWMYLLSAIALVGCELNAERERAAVPPASSEEA